MYCFLWPFLTVKFFKSFYKGPAYGSTLRDKMKIVQKASGVIDDTAGMGMHQRLKDIHEVALTSMYRKSVIWHMIDKIAAKFQALDLKKEQKEVKKLALEARNHLYLVFRDADLLRELMQSRSSSRRVWWKRSADYSRPCGIWERNKKTGQK